VLAVEIHGITCEWGVPAVQ